MIDYSDLAFGLLEPTSTYVDRAWGWYDATGEHGIGLLTIELTFANGQLEERRYCVHELDPLPGLLGRRFALHRQGAEQVYQVTLGALPSCTCTAGQCRAKQASVCKHLDAMKAVEDRGLLGPQDNERSGLAYHDEPGEPTISELTISEALSHGTV